jgi:hypothetical protein
MDAVLKYAPVAGSRTVVAAPAVPRRVPFVASVKVTVPFGGGATKFAALGLIAAVTVTVPE